MHVKKKQKKTKNKTTSCKTWNSDSIKEKHGEGVSRYRHRERLSEKASAQKIKSRIDTLF